MINITNPSDCCGCTACASICSHQAIKMVPDTLGFLYPSIDLDKCTQCGLCEKVCAFNKNYDKSNNLELPLSFGARHKSMQEIETSRSGAAFIALSDWILEQGGSVYGVGYTEHFKVTHKRALTKEERNEFKGSKYVQSDLNHVFLNIKEDLKQGMIVLFSGTPCQTSGLASFINPKLRKNLYLMDIVCHGVPGPFVWKDYLIYTEKRYGKQVTEVNFRDKQQFGWAAHKESFKINQKTISSRIFTDLFYKHIMFRHSCGICHFTNLKRPSDITIADFWGWQKSHSTFNEDDKGCSLILVNTEKGISWWNNINHQLHHFPVQLTDCLQPNLQHPSIVHPLRNEFENDYARKGFLYILNKYSEFGWRNKIQNYKNRIKQKIKRLFTQS